MGNDALRSELIERVHANHCTVAGCLATTEAEQDVDTMLSALSEAGYSVVETEWEYGFLLPKAAWPSQCISRDSALRNAKARKGTPVRRRRHLGSWEPFPEPCAKALGGSGE